VYGMINEAMRRHVEETAGADAWGRIAVRADAPRSFASLHYYDDAVTYALVGAASTELGAPAEDLLRSFGHYWSLRVGPENYADILGATGTDVVSVLTHLDEMHARLQVLYPELRPPSFTVVDDGSDSFEVHYTSEREGLAPFVVGLLEGLGDLYGTPAKVVQVSDAGEGRPSDVFRVSLEK
jgi:hypothetical protein